MKKTEHQIFLKKNNLDKKLLLEPIQEKIEIFDRMYKLLDTVTDCEKSDLQEQLESLDLEVMEDIDKEYADTLSNNEFTEEAIIEIKLKPKKLSDEAILNELTKMGRTENIGRSTFRDLGLKISLGWDTIIGKYRVKRTSVFKYRYSIELK